MPFIVILTHLIFFFIKKNNNYFEKSLSLFSRYDHSLHFGIFGLFLLPLVKKLFRNSICWALLMHYKWSQKVFSNSRLVTGLACRNRPIPHSWKNGRGIIFTGGATWWRQSWIFTKKMIKSRFETVQLNHFMRYIILKNTTF